MKISFAVLFAFTSFAATPALACDGYDGAIYGYGALVAAMTATPAPKAEKREMKSETPPQVTTSFADSASTPKLPPSVGARECKRYFPAIGAVVSVPCS